MNKTVTKESAGDNDNIDKIEGILVNIIITMLYAMIVIYSLFVLGIYLGIVALPIYLIYRIIKMLL
jgi:hypothetical protein